MEASVSLLIDKFQQIPINSGNFRSFAVSSLIEKKKERKFRNNLKLNPSIVESRNEFSFTVSLKDFSVEGSQEKSSLPGSHIDLFPGSHKNYSFSDSHKDLSFPDLKIPHSQSPIKHSRSLAPKLISRSKALKKVSRSQVPIKISRFQVSIVMSFKQAPIKNYRIKNLGQKLSKLDAFFYQQHFYRQHQAEIHEKSRKS